MRVGRACRRGLQCFRVCENLGAYNEDKQKQGGLELTKDQAVELLL